MKSYNDLRKNEDFFEKTLLNRTHITTDRGAIDSGHVTPSKALLHGHLNKGSFSIFTAENPGAKKLSSYQNQLNNAHLENKLKSMGAVYHKVKGKYGGHEENSFMVHHTAKVQPHQLEELARQHGQESILHSSMGQHRLKYIVGPNAGSHHPGKGYELNPKSQDNFSQVPGKPETKFSANLDFGQMNKTEGHKTLSFEIDTPEGKHDLHFHFDHAIVKP